MLAARKDLDVDSLGMSDIAKARILVLSDGRTGSENRSLGVVEMLGVKDPEVVTMKPKYSGKLMKMLPVSMLYEGYDNIVRDISKYDVVIPLIQHAHGQHVV